MEGFEPPTPSLPWKCSTPELHWPVVTIDAGHTSGAVNGQWPVVGKNVLSLTPMACILFQYRQYLSVWQLFGYYVGILSVVLKNRFFCERQKMVVANSYPCTLWRSRKEGNGPPQMIVEEASFERETRLEPATLSLEG